MKLFVVLLTVLFLGAGVYGLDVKTMYIDQPPKFILKDGTFSGLAIDIMKAVEKADPQLHFVGVSKAFTPIARVEKALEDGEIDAYVGFVKTPERAAKFQLVVPLYQTSNVFLAAAGETATFKTLEEFKAVNKDAPVLSVSNSAPAQYLKKQGFKVDDGSANFGVAFDKLLQGRARFLFVPDMAGYAFLKEQGLGSKVKVFPPVTGTEDQYFCFAKNAPPALVAAVTAALTKMKASGALAAVVAPYLASR